MGSSGTHSDEGCGRRETAAVRFWLAALSSVSTWGRMSCVKLAHAPVTTACPSDTQDSAREV